MRNDVTCSTLGLLLVTGCAQSTPGPLLTPRTDARRWPPPPAEARVRFLGKIASAQDLDAPTNLWQRIVGSTPAGKLVTPTGVAVDDDGALYVLDADARAVHLFDLDRRRHTIIGAGVLELPSAICWGDGRLFVADAGAAAVHAWSPAKGWHRFDRGGLERPAGLVYVRQSHRLCVSDLGAAAIRVYNADGQLEETWTAPQVKLGSPTHLAYHPDVGLVVADSLGGRVVQLDLDGRQRGLIGSPGDGPGNLALPKGVAIDSRGHVYVVDARFENVQVFDAQGRILMSFGSEGTGDGEFWLPAGMCIDRQDRIWVADTYNCRVQVFEYVGAVSDEP
ncbi:MAG: hypothetical protein GY778_06110 [bacterium]|nr:hypothetical protein [bacterium]